MIIIFIIIYYFHLHNYNYNIIIVYTHTIDKYYTGTALRNSELEAKFLINTCVVLQ